VSGMPVALPGGYELDDRLGRVDLDVVHGFLAFESYWARGRSRELVARSWAGSARVIGCYLGEAQVGGARVISDRATYAYLDDLFVRPEHRGRGLGVAIVREALDHPEFAPLRWSLQTADAHSLYERFGFVPATVLERAAHRGAPHGGAGEADPR
jgi:GNAT superfamily N-acetyltransferase